MVQVSPEIALTTPSDSAIQLFGVNEVTDHLETREVGTLMKARYGEV